jgi:hypothetical protein
MATSAAEPGAAESSGSASASTQPTSAAGSPLSAPAAEPTPAPASPASSASSDPDAPLDGDADPLYDPRADAADAAWVRRNLGGGGADGTDVRLTCPSCFVLLCARAQAHAEYVGQWRAVFVRNCSVREAETVRVRVEGGEAGTGEVFRPVACTRCRTEVGVLDEDDVYHFCNVLS